MQFKIPGRTSSQKTIPMEYTERVSNLLLVFIDGLRDQLSENESLRTALDKLDRVVRKVARVKKTTHLGMDIEDHFKAKKSEALFRETGEPDTKDIILSMANAIKDVLSGIDDYGDNLDEYIEEIESTENLNEILVIKDRIIEQARKFKSRTEDLKKELEISRKTTLELSQQLEQTKSKALIDPLTKVLNRNAYNIRILQTIREYKRYKEPTSLILADIDHFKKFNDEFGHRIGDRVLRSVASSIQEAIRSSDLVFRYGGEEFVILPKRSSLNRANEIAEKIRKQVEKDYYVDQGRKLKVTISLGVTAIREEDTAETLFKRVDQVLYTAKLEGRNRVEIRE